METESLLELVEEELELESVVLVVLVLAVLVTTVLVPELVTRLTLMEIRLPSIPFLLHIDIDAAGSD
jgi:hypothetical protein